MRKLAKILLKTGPFSKMAPQTLIEKYQKFLSFDTDINQIQIYTDIPEYNCFLNEVKDNLLRITQTFELEYSKEEYNEAEYFLFDSNSYLRSVYEDQPEKCYSLRCPTCKVYIEQNKDLIIKKKTFGAKMISLSWEEELIVSPDVKNLFEESKIENLDFRPVFNNYEEINPIAYQVIATNILPSNDTRTEMRQVISCDSCNFKSFVLTPEHAMYYSKDEINKFHDINRTYEFFGSGFFPRPYLVVSKKVREMVLNNKVKGVTFQPIFFAY